MMVHRCLPFVVLIAAWGALSCTRFALGTAASAQEPTKSAPPQAIQSEPRSETVQSAEPFELPCLDTATRYEPPSRWLPTDNLELMAVDIARRALLIQHPHAGKNPIRTTGLSVRVQGDLVHAFVRLEWSTAKLGPTNEAEVFCSLFYRPDWRRVYDINYRDSHRIPNRNFNLMPDLVASYNEELQRRDTLGLPMPVAPDPNVLAPVPRSRTRNGLLPRGFVNYGWGNDAGWFLPPWR